MKNNILNILAIACISLLALSCTKHDPFDIIGSGGSSGTGSNGGNDGDGTTTEEEVWILSKFAKTNTIDFAQGNVTFFENVQSHVLLKDDDQYKKLSEPDIRAYYSYDDLKSAGLLDVPVSDGKGNYYRVPTAGELVMMMPAATAPDDFFGILDFCATSESKKDMTETVYLANDDDSSTNVNGAAISGKSSFYFASGYSDGNADYNPVFAVRFKGTPQHAAYRYDIVKIKSGAENGYLDIFGVRILAVRLSEDAEVKVEDVANEAYFKTQSAIELVLPMLCMMHGDVDRYLYGSGYGSAGYFLSSTIDENSYVANFSTMGIAYVGRDTYGTHMRYPLRLLKCKADGSL